jgi:hypothetical protein
MTVTELNNMTDEEFDNFMNGVKAENPNLLQYIADFINGFVTSQEVDIFLKMKPRQQQEYIKNYKARA